MSYYKFILRNVKRFGTKRLCPCVGQGRLALLAAGLAGGFIALLTGFGKVLAGGATFFKGRIGQAPVVECVRGCGLADQHLAKVVDGLVVLLQPVVQQAPFRPELGIFGVQVQGLV